MPELLEKPLFFYWCPWDLKFIDVRPRDLFPKEHSAMPACEVRCPGGCGRSFDIGISVQTFQDAADNTRWYKLRDEYLEFDTFAYRLNKKTMGKIKKSEEISYKFMHSGVAFVVFDLNLDPSKKKLPAEFYYMRYIFQLPPVSQPATLGKAVHEARNRVQKIWVARDDKETEFITRALSIQAGQ